jgi:Mg-chelatase subunit ChlD
MTNVHISGEVLAEAAQLAPGSEHYWVAVRLDTGAAPERRVRVVLALDRSSSMRGAKLEAAKRAARTLVALMRDDDELGVVLFDGRIDVVQPVTRVDSRLRASVGELLDGVRAGHGTALADAMITALAQARPERGGAIAGEGHAIVLTDGFPYVGETDPKKITALVGVHAIEATLTTIAFGDDLDGPLLASMAQMGLGRFLHLGERDDAPAALAAELATTAGEVTSRARVTVQLKDGLAVAYRGMPERGFPHPTIELALPPLVEGDSVVWPIAVQPLQRLGAGTHEVGLATVRATRLDGTPLVLELPMRVEVGEKRGAPNTEVMRARCLFHAARIMRMVATDEVAVPRLVSLLRDMAAHIYGQAVAVGLAHDGPITAAVRMLRHAAAMLDEHGDVSRVAASAAAAGLEARYDSSIGSAKSPLFELRTLTQQHGATRATLIEPMIEAPARERRAPRPSLPPPAALPEIAPPLPEWKVRIVYVEPTYAKHHDQPEQEYSGTFTVRASNEAIAEALARDEFQRAAKKASVGWVRTIVRVEISRVR